ncbi:hypothetical protein OG780_19315 [Streptomyces sp. NBC_00386]|uniref:hypothetical protein n=1 Tax=Streptomyces sp. NBC_00386 TaxID=2975734 RepID=UPI002E1C665D
MTREQRLSMADAANTRAATLARDAERAARGDARAIAVPLAAAGGLWAQVASSHAAIAAAMTSTDDITPEA